MDEVLNNYAGVSSEMIPEEGNNKLTQVLADIARSQRTGVITQKKRDEWTDYLVSKALAHLHEECFNYYRIKDKVAAAGP